MAKAIYFAALKRIGVALSWHGSSGQYTVMPKQLAYSSV